MPEGTEGTAPGQSNTATLPPPSSEQDSSQEADSGNWMNAVIRGDNPNTPSDEPIGDPDAAGKEGVEADASTVADTGTESSSTSQQQQIVSLTQEQLNRMVQENVQKLTTGPEFERRVQSEVDRRNAIAEKRAKAERLKQLREADPFEYVEEVKKDEAANEEVMSQAEREAEERLRITTVMAQTGSLYDRALLDPIAKALPAELQRSLLEETNPVGLEGRAAFATRAIAEVARIARQEGEEKAKQSLRTNEAFRKELLRELRGGEDEPDILQGTAATHVPRTDMNTIIRQSAGRYAGPG